MMVLDRLDVLIQEILDGKNIPETSHELRAQLARDLKQRLLNRINRAVIEALPDEDIDELDRLTNNPRISEQQIQDFFRQSNVDVQRIANESIQRFRDEYLTVNKEIVK